MIIVFHDIETLYSITTVDCNMRIVFHEIETLYSNTIVDCNTRIAVQ